MEVTGAVVCKPGSRVASPVAPAEAWDDRPAAEVGRVSETWCPCDASGLSAS
jgi:hypothetical protein